MKSLALRPLALVIAIVVAACGATQPEFSHPPPLPPCARPIGSIYVPGQYAAQNPPPAPPPETAKPASMPAPKRPKFARLPYKPRGKTPPPPPPVVTPEPMVTCGGVKNPCPLQRWMRENMAPALAGKDGAALAAALDKMATFSPVASWEWRAISEKAATAARAGDITLARQSCQGCHKAHKVEYQQKFRGKIIR